MAYWLSLGLKLICRQEEGIILGINMFLDILLGLLGAGTEKKKQNKSQHEPVWKCRLMLVLFSSIQDKKERATLMLMLGKDGWIRPL